MSRQSAWPRLMALFRLIHSGSAHGAFPLQPYGGALFRPGQDDDTDPVSRALFILEHQVDVNDATIYRVLKKLLRGPLPVMRGRSKTYVEGPVDYTELRTEFIGLIYEGLLDYRLKRTSEEVGPQVFLNLGRQPVLPLSRLESMLEDDPKAMKDLFVELRKEAVVPSVTTDDDGDADEDGDETDESADVLQDVELPKDSTEEESRTTSYLDAVHAARRWARRALLATKLVGEQKPKETDTEYATRIEDAIDELIDRVVAPNEFYLVRAGNTRKGTGTFYTRPQLAVPTVHRALEPLCYRRTEDGTLEPKTPESILSLKVCDPACGSASFLVAALLYLSDALYKSLCHHRFLDDPAHTANLTLPFGRKRSKENQESEEIVPFLPDDPTQGEHFREWVEVRLRRHVVERCIYGVDVNPLAVEFARVSLWVETLDDKLPFSFLDHKIKCGNALIGGWLDVFEHYPIAAWNRSGGDDSGNTKGARTQSLETFLKGEKQSNGRRSGDGLIKKELRKQITDKRLASTGLFAGLETNLSTALQLARTEYEALHDFPASHDPDERERLFKERILESESLSRLKRAMDEWCSVWFWPTSDDSLGIVPTPSSFHNSDTTKQDYVEAVADRQRFFHWELEFPDVFTEERDGFSAIIGNPPWDTIQQESQEFFSDYDPLYRTYGKQEALRKQSELFADAPDIRATWEEYCSDLAALRNWVKQCCAPFAVSLMRGRANTDLHRNWESQRQSPTFARLPHPFAVQGSGKNYTYKLFLELALNLTASDGSVAMVLPSGVHTDSGSQEIRELLLGRLSFLCKLDNENGFFSGLEHNSKFVVLIIDGQARDSFDAAFFRKAPIDAIQSPSTTLVQIRHDSVKRVSPLSMSVPEVYSQSSLATLEAIYEHSETIPSHLADFSTDFNMTTDSRSFKPTGELPLYQGSMIWQFDHRYNFYVREQRKWHRGKLENVEFRHCYPLRPKHWVSFEAWHKKFEDDYSEGLPRCAFYRLAYRVQQNMANQRTMVCAILPRFAVVGHSVNVLSVDDPRELVLASALFNSFVVDFVVRTKVSANVSKFYLQQLPFPCIEENARTNRICELALRLVSTTPHYADLWSSVAPTCGLPATWQPDLAFTQPSQRRRAVAEIDALVGDMFHLTERQFKEILSTFHLVDRHLPVEQRHQTLAMQCFLDGVTSEVLEETEVANNGELFSNEWVPEGGWDALSSCPDEMLNLVTWTERYGELAKEESSASGDVQRRLF